VAGVADTIFAVASGPGPAGVAVIRISGAGARAALVSLTARTQWYARRATRVRIVDGAGESLDDALALWFPRPASYTGEDVAELHVHGGRAVVAGVLHCLGRMRGLRPAGPGEFTRRAFENDKLDLTQAEAIADLVAAETAAQCRQALRQLDGELRRLYEGWRERLLRAMVWAEAAIDFADEDLPEGLQAAAREDIALLLAEVRRHLRDGGRGERIREGFSIVLIGSPNAGKSTLINALCGRDVSIVDAEPGTTRDIVEAGVVLNGVPVVISDTAGLRDDGGRVEAEGVRRALARGGTADVRVAVFDGAVWPALDPQTLAVLELDDTIPVVTKADLGRVVAPAKIAGDDATVVCALSGAGLDGLRARLETMIGRACSGEGPTLTRLRHRRALEVCEGALDRAAGAGSCETLAEDLRVASFALGAVVGRVGVEDVLDGIFREFCIGK